MSRPPNTVVETSPYLAQAKGVLTAEDRVAVIDMIASDPKCGDVIVGSGGVRKVRYAVGNKGKSGGTRIIYAFRNEDYPIFLLAVFAKNERATLSKSEVNALAKVVRMIFDHYGE